MKAKTKWSAAPFILFVLLLLLCVHASAYTTPDGYIYTADSGGITITGYSGTAIDLVIPEAIGELPIKAIGSKAFQNKSALKSVTLPDSVLSVGDYAFDSCYAVESIALGDGLQNVGKLAFSNCSALTTLDMPDSITNIGPNAFMSDIALTSVKLPVNLTKISSMLFWGCTKLGSVSIPTGVTSIEYQAFYGCSRLTDITIPDGVTSIIQGAFQGCASLTGIQLPNSVTNIGSEAFYKCTSLESIIIPEHVPYISPSMFYGCTSLESVTLPSGVTAIYEYAFNSCESLVSINLTEGLKSIDTCAFNGCGSLTGITLPSTTTFIGPYAFRSCKKLTHVNIPSGVTRVGNEAFSGCSHLTSVDFLSAGVTDIEQSLFSGCSNLKDINLPSGITSIGTYAFSNCSSLKGINLPSGVTSIGASAFSGCSSLTSVEIPGGVTRLRDSTFSGCLALTSAHFPAGLEIIGDSVFFFCSALEGINLPSGVTSIGDSVFSYCKALKRIDIPSSVTAIGDKIFYGCNGLISVKLPDSLESIGQDAFYYTGARLYVYYGSYAWQYCTATYPSNTVVMDILLSESALTMGLGTERQLTATVQYYNPGHKVVWTSDTPAVATVDQNGLVTAVTLGRATVTASIEGDKNLTASCLVQTVKLARQVILNKKSATLYTGETLTLTVMISPGDASVTDIEWSSSDEDVATVDGGVITALKAGSATITAATVDGSGISTTCAVTVKQYATGLAMGKESASLYPGEGMWLTVAVSPEDASDKSIAWESSDETVATIESGFVVGVKAGTTTITATTMDGSSISASCEVTVLVPAASVTLGPVTKALVRTGDTLALSAQVLPENAHDHAVTWSTSDTFVAQVDGGVVTGLNRGTATITAYAHNGRKATCEVQVDNRVVELLLSVPAGTPFINGGYDLNLGAQIQIATKTLPDKIWYSLSYQSSNKSVASVTSSGVVKGITRGRATITVTSKDWSQSIRQSQITFNVISPVGNVSLPGEAQILTGAAKRLTATVSPSSASYKTLTWDSDNKAVATVAQDGTVTALKAGKANIMATAHNGQSASCLVRVTDPATGVQIATATGKAYVNYKTYLQLTATVSPGTAYGAVTWKSSNTDYVTVDVTGKVYGRKVGKATVYATAADGLGVRGPIEIQVITPMTALNLPETDKVFINKAKKLTATLSPSSPTFKTLSWKSGNEAVATVAADGTVTAKALGTAVITATAYNGLSDTCTVTVAQPVTGITLAPPKNGTVVYKGETAEALEAVVAPGNANDQELTWKSSSTKYATVDAQGFVTGRSAGKVKITATAKDGSGVTGSVSLTIVTPATSVKLNKNSVVLYQNGTGTQKVLQLTATASPKGSVYRALNWSVVSGEAAIVDASAGLVTAVKNDTAVIRATTDRGRTADCAVTVRTLPATFGLNTTEKTLAFKQSFDLGVEAIFDAVCTEKALTWTSKNKNVATVSSTGVVKASKNKTGTTIITATTKNGKTAICKITVVKSLPKSATGTPAAEATVPCVALKLTGGGYATSDDHVADVDGSGNVKLKADGTATLEAGGKQISVKVEGGNLSELKLDEGAGLQLGAGAEIRWTVEDGEIAAVDGDGQLTALREGTTTLICQAENGVEWTIRIVVTRPEEVEPQPNPEPSSETEQILPEPTPETEPTVVPEPEPSSEPTASEDPSPTVESSPSSEPSVEPGPTAKPEPSGEPEPSAEPKPEKTSAPEADSDPNSAPAQSSSENSAEG